MRSSLSSTSFQLANFTAPLNPRHHCLYMSLLFDNDFASSYIHIVVIRYASIAGPAKKGLRGLTVRSVFENIVSQ